MLSVQLWLAGFDAPDWPSPRETAHAERASADAALVRAQPVCLLNSVPSAGELGPSLVVRHRRDGDRLWVSYFAYWSSERPWGDKPFVVSLAIDAFYSHFMFFLPGLRHALYGPGDIEGATVVYRVAGDRLEILEGYGDDEYHRPVHLAAGELTGSENQTLLMTTSWSHQLGGRDAARAARDGSASTRCFVGDELVPMTREIADKFRLGSAASPLRARYAWL